MQDLTNGALTQLNGAADFAKNVELCPTRFVLSDELTRLCTALAYSKGAHTLACADLLHVPAESVWVEWCEAPWHAELELYGFRSPPDNTNVSGRRGALIQAARDGRRGSIRTFWTTGESELDVLASSMEAYFDFDALDGEEPIASDDHNGFTVSVSDHAGGDANILRRCFRFRYERTWSDYYLHAAPSLEQSNAIARHALGTIAIDISMLLAFFLLLSTRPGLPRKPLMLERLNRSRAKNGKAPLLDHVEVFAPLIPHFQGSNRFAPTDTRRSPRLHHVRGHLVRRGSELFWRVPHLRGSVRAGAVRSRTVTWTVDTPSSGRSEGKKNIGDAPKNATIFGDRRDLSQLPDARSAPITLEAE